MKVAYKILNLPSYITALLLCCSLSDYSISCLSSQRKSRAIYTVTILVSGLLCLLTGFVVLKFCGSGVVSPHYIDFQCLGTNHYLTLLPILQEKAGPISVVSRFLFAVNKNTRVFPMTQTATMIISCLSPQGACHPHKNSNYTVTIVVSGLLCLLTGFIVLTFCGSQGVVSRH